jgi:hypothetical protein
MTDFSRNIEKFNLFENSLILLFWLLLFASPFLLGQSYDTIDWKHVFKIWEGHSILLTLFLLNRFILLPYLFFRNKRTVYILSAFCLISFAVIGMYLYDSKPALRNKRAPPSNSILSDRLGGRPDIPSPPPWKERPRPSNSSNPEPVPAYINLLILSVLVFGFDTGLRITSKWVHSEQHRMSLEKENVETQLAFLKHQVSPHFFMNTLNNIHSLIDIDSVEAKKSVIKLSNLMRHLLYESDNEMSPIKSEVDFIKSYVDLMKLRYSNEVRINFKAPRQIPDKSIPPLLFISLLDNAFKHGISYVSDSFVEIELSITSDKLCIIITNSKNKEASYKSVSGIGMQNTRKRLDLLYKENYTLDITDRGNIFITNLTIPV